MQTKTVAKAAPIHSAILVASGLALAALSSRVTNASEAAPAFHFTTTTQIIPSTVTQPEDCAVSPLKVGIDVYDWTQPSGSTAKTSLPVTCSKDTVYAIQLNAGLHPGGVSGLMHRQMVNTAGDQYLAYTLRYTGVSCDASAPSTAVGPPTGTNPAVLPNQVSLEWGDGKVVGTTYTSVISTNGAKSECFNIEIDVPGGQYVTPGTYSDTITTNLDY